MENDNKIKKEELNFSFLKKIWYSICKFERYPEMAALGIKQALVYLTEIIIILSILYTMIFIRYIKIKNNFTQNDMTLSKQILVMIEKDRDLDEKEKEAFDYIMNKDGDTDIILLILTCFVVFFSLYITTLIDVLMLSCFGLITCFAIRIKINYKAIFNMSIYALTLSLILKIIYYFITMLTSFSVKYFSLMYIAISYISLAAAIFIIKSNIIKQHLELMKIIEDRRDKIESDMISKRKKEDEEKKEEKNNDEDNNSENNENDKDIGTEEQGSNA